MAWFGIFSFRLPFWAPHPNNSLLFRVYPARQRIPGSVPRNWLKTGQKTCPGWA